MIAFSEYVPVWERNYLTALLKESLAIPGMHLSLAVIGGENGEYEVRRTQDAQQVAMVMALGDGDLLVLEAKDEVSGKHQFVGTFMLIYNNGSQGDPEVVVADYNYTRPNEATMDLICEKARVRANL